MSLDETQMQENEAVAEIVVTDQSIYAPDVADKIAKATHRIKELDREMRKQMLSSIVQIGQELYNIKGDVGHGNWYGWLEENFGYTDRNALFYIEIYQVYGASGLIEKSESIAELSYSKALKLKDLPEDQILSLVEHGIAEKGDVHKMSVRELEKQLKIMRAQYEAEGQEKQKLEDELSLLKEKNQEVEREREELESTVEQLKADSNTKDETIAEYEERIQTLSMEAAALNKEALKTVATVQKLEKKEKEAAKRLAIQEVSRQISTFETALKSVDQEIKAAQDKKTVKKKEQERTELASQLATAQATKIVYRLETKKENLEALISEITSELFELAELDSAMAKQEGVEVSDTINSCLEQFRLLEA